MRLRIDIVFPGWRWLIGRAIRGDIRAVRFSLAHKFLGWLERPE